jgi:hypothetical protein
VFIFLYNKQSVSSANLKFHNFCKYDCNILFWSMLHLEWVDKHTWSHFRSLTISTNGNIEFYTLNYLCVALLSCCCNSTFYNFTVFHMGLLPLKKACFLLLERYLSHWWETSKRINRHNSLQYIQDSNFIPNSRGIWIIWWF